MQLNFASNPVLINDAFSAAQSASAMPAAILLAAAIAAFLGFALSRPRRHRHN